MEDESRFLQSSLIFFPENNCRVLYGKNPLVVPHDHESTHHLIILQHCAKESPLSLIDFSFITIIDFRITVVFHSSRFYTAIHISTPMSSSNGSVQTDRVSSVFCKIFPGLFHQNQVCLIPQRLNRSMQIQMLHRRMSHKHRILQGNYKI